MAFGVVELAPEGVARAQIPVGVGPGQKPSGCGSIRCPGLCGWRMPMHQAPARLKKDVRLIPGGCQCPAQASAG